MGSRLQLAGIRVLLVDDSEDQLDLLGTLFRRAGAEVATARTAQEAFDAFQASPPDIVISDISMPHGSGYNLIRMIRSSRKPGADVPAIAVTAYGLVEVPRKAMDAGFTDWLSKPASDTVVSTAAKLLRR